MRKYYFFGIGGIGMSALAQYVVAIKKGYVKGCDLALYQDTIRILMQKKISCVHQDEWKNSVEKFQPDYFVFTNAISPHSDCALYAQKHNIPILYRAELLKECLVEKNVIGITGSHGKTTTTALAAHVLKDTFCDPTVFVGGIMHEEKNNFILGKSNVVVLEADDAYKSFLSLEPAISVIHNISYEHLETYKNWDDIRLTYAAYAELTKKEGRVIYNTDDENIGDSVKNISSSRKISYGIWADKIDVKAFDIQYYSHSVSYSLLFENNTYDVTFCMAGIHSVYNSLAAIAIGLVCGLTMSEIIEKLATYKGVFRRCDYIGSIDNKIRIYDDYAHHPKELDYALDVFCNRYSGSSIVVIFQPHKYTRMKVLWEEFVAVFKKYQNNIDTFYITDVYDAVFEGHDTEYNSKKLVDQLNRECTGKMIIEYVPFENNFCSIFKEKIEKTCMNTDKKWTVVCLGAGRMNEVASFLFQENEKIVNC